MENYNRKLSTVYARRWAYSRNPKFYDFSFLGGDCANFASQCLQAGGCPMNFSRSNGWFYISLNNRSPSWSGTEFLYSFLTRKEETTGPVAVETAAEELLEGDIIQLSFDGKLFSHNLVVVGFGKQSGMPYVAAHSNDVFGKALNAYTYQRARFLHILGFYK